MRRLRRYYFRPVGNFDKNSLTIIKNIWRNLLVVDIPKAFIYYYYSLHLYIYSTVSTCYQITARTVDLYTEAYPYLFCGEPCRRLGF